MRLLNSSPKRSILLSNKQIISPQTFFEIDEKEALLLLKLYPSIIVHADDAIDPKMITDANKMMHELQLLKIENKLLKEKIQELEITNEESENNNLERTTLLAKAKELGIEHKFNTPTIKLKTLIDEYDMTLQNIKT